MKCGEFTERRASFLQLSAHLGCCVNCAKLKMQLLWDVSRKISLRRRFSLPLRLTSSKTSFQRLLLLIIFSCNICVIIIMWYILFLTLLLWKCNFHGQSQVTWKQVVGIYESTLQVFWIIFVRVLVLRPKCFRCPLNVYGVDFYPLLFRQRLDFYTTWLL